MQIVFTDYTGTHSVPNSHYPMGRLSDTTGERSGVGRRLYVFFEAKREERHHLPNSRLLLRIFILRKTRLNSFARFGNST